MKSKKSLLLLVALVAKSISAFGCLWDSDTLASERVRFPEVAFLITGVFPRHSNEFYEWRREYCEEMIKRNPRDIPMYDDLAVSQHKLGDHKAAISTMEAKEKQRPGMYETYSNLGTFYIYTGELDRALEYIRKALGINPDAHFGRERYQARLVEWVMEQKKRSAEDRELDFGLIARGKAQGFAEWIARKQHGGSQQDPALTPKEQSEAVRGLSGMIRFADFDNPLLQEALGDILICGDMKTNATNLASLCYLHASHRVSDAAEKQRLRGKAEVAGEMSRGFSIPSYESILLSGLKKGKEYAENIRQEEIAWIAAKADAAAEFRKKYLTP